MTTGLVALTAIIYIVDIIATSILVMKLMIAVLLTITLPVVAPIGTKPMTQVVLYAQQPCLNVQVIIMTISMRVTGVALLLFVLPPSFLLNSALMGGVI